MPHFANLLIFSFLLIGFDTGLRVSFRLAETEQAKAKLEKENVGTQLAFLRNQVSPHFFMNTLNNIHSLIDFDSEEAKESLYHSALELGNYVCRLCGKCMDENGFKPWEIFLLEGLYDRQMDSYHVPNPAHYALQERLKFWFHQEDWAQEEYVKLVRKVDPDTNYSHLNTLCPYNIDIDRKLNIAHAKLSRKEYIL